MNKITKIIELLIDWDNEDIDDVGVEIMSLVDTPAIGVSWQAFAKQAFDEADDIEMVDGIIELLNKVEDIENRKKMAQDVLEDFEGDNIDYNKERFLELIGLHQMPNGDLMEGTDHKGQEFSEESIIDIIISSSAPRLQRWLSPPGWQKTPTTATVSLSSPLRKAVSCTRRRSGDRSFPSIATRPESGQAVRREGKGGVSIGPLH